MNRDRGRGLVYQSALAIRMLRHLSGTRTPLSSGKSRSFLSKRNWKRPTLGMSNGGNELEVGIVSLVKERQRPSQAGESCSMATISMSTCSYPCPPSVIAHCSAEAQHSRIGSCRSRLQIRGRMRTYRTCRPSTCRCIFAHSHLHHHRHELISTALPPLRREIVRSDQMVPATMG